MATAYNADSPVAKRALSNPASYAGNSINIGGVTYDKDASGNFVSKGSSVPTTPANPTQSTVNTPTQSYMGYNPPSYGKTPTADEMLIGRDLNKEKAQAIKLGVDANSIAKLSVPNLLEATYSQSELANMPYYQYMKSTEAANKSFSNMQDTGQIQAPTATMMRPLEEALKTKMSVGKEKLGEADVFKAAGLDPYINLAQSLQQHSTDMQQKYASYANVMGNVAGGLSDTYKGALQQYKDHVEQYNKELDRITTIIDRQAALDQQLTILNKQAAINREQSQWELDHPGLAARTNAFTAGMTDASGNIISTGSGTIPKGPIVEAQLGQDKLEGDKVIYKAPKVKGQQVMIDALQKADADYFAATGEHIKINESYRSVAEQAAIRKKWGYTSDSQASGEGGKPMAAAPGKSFHQTGLAIDIPEDVARKAEQYLRKYGLVNDVPNDYGHFSMGETNPEFFTTAASDDNAIVAALAKVPKDLRTAVTQRINQFDNEPTVRNFQIVQEGYDFVKSIPSDTHNPADDQGIIYAFAKIMDPGSVVREGEYATVQKYAQTWKDSFGFKVDRILNNTEFLSEEAVSNLKKTIESKYKSSVKSYDQVRNEAIRNINNTAGKDVGSDLLQDYKLSLPAESTSNASKLGLDENFDPWALINSAK